MTHESPQTKGKEADKQEQQLVDSIENLKKIIENLEQNKSIDGENQINDIFKRSFLSLLEKINEENPDKIKELYQKITKTLSNTENNTIAAKERQSLEEIEILLRPYSGFQREIPIPAYKETGRKETYNEKWFISNAKDIVANAEFIPAREKERIMLFLDNPNKENIQNLQRYILWEGRWLENFNIVEFYQKSFDKNFTGTEKEINFKRTPDGKFGSGTLAGFNLFMQSYNQNFKELNESYKRSLELSNKKTTDKDFFKKIVSKNTENELDTKSLAQKSWLSNLTENKAKINPKQAKKQTIKADLVQAEATAALDMPELAIPEEKIDIVPIIPIKKQTIKVDLVQAEATASLDMPELAIPEEKIDIVPIIPIKKQTIKVDLVQAEATASLDMPELAIPEEKIDIVPITPIKKQAIKVDLVQAEATASLDMPELAIPEEKIDIVPITPIKKQAIKVDLVQAEATASLDMPELAIPEEKIDIVPITPIKKQTIKADLVQAEATAALDMPELAIPEEKIDIVPIIPIKKQTIKVDLVQAEATASLDMPELAIPEEKIDIATKEIISWYLYKNLSRSKLSKLISYNLKQQQLLTCQIEKSICKSQ
jgi:hypothetical protein